MLKSRVFIFVFGPAFIGIKITFSKIYPKFSLGKYAKNQHKGKFVAFQIGRVINSQFSTLYERIEKLCDPRKHREYALAELVFGGIAMFMFKFGSRNQFDNYRKEGVFKKNYYRTFKMRLPSSDAIEDLMRLLEPSELEALKATIIKELIRHKVFHKFRFVGKKFLIAVDGTGTSTYSSDYCGQCTSKTSKNGNTTYFHYVLEAKLVTSNDMGVSIATEWVENRADGDYEKQDCEQKAFLRLAVKLKKMFPRLPLVILADGLYPNQTIFETCRNNGWDFIFTFKDGNLPSIHKEMELLPSSPGNTKERILAKGGVLKHQVYTWKDNMDYNGTSLSVISCKETSRRIKKQEGKPSEPRVFTHISNLEINSDNCIAISDSGRLRWVIENSFDYLKNHGYNLGHKFSRVSFSAYKNYYQCMMIAHVINQFVEKSTDFIELKNSALKQGILFLWQRLISFFTDSEIDVLDLDKYVKRRTQIRLA